MIQMFFAGFAVNESLNLDPHPHQMDQNQKPSACFPQGLMEFLSGSGEDLGVVVKVLYLFSDCKIQMIF